MSSGDVYTTFKMPETTDSRSFFHEHCADSWDFLSYFSKTHNDSNKFKAFRKIRNDYLADLDWIFNSRVPCEIKEYVMIFKNDVVKYLYGFVFNNNLLMYFKHKYKQPSKPSIKAGKAKSTTQYPIKNREILICGGDNRDSSFNITVTEGS